MPRKLLLADDSLTMQKVVAITFAHEDFTVSCVDNGEDALARVREMRPDVVLADVVMPRRNGYELCEAIKADPATSGIPVLLLAGTFEAFDEARARAAGADGHIGKPFESGALIEKVRSLVGGSPAAAQVAAPAPMQAAQPAIPRPGAPLAPPRPAVPQAPRPPAPSPQAPMPVAPPAPALRPPMPMPPPPAMRPPAPPPQMPGALRPLGPPPPAPPTSPRPFPVPTAPQVMRPPPPPAPRVPVPMPRPPVPPSAFAAGNGMAAPLAGTPGPGGALQPRPPAPPLRPSALAPTPGPAHAVTPAAGFPRPNAPIHRAEDQLSLDDDLSISMETPPAGRYVPPTPPARPPAAPAPAPAAVVQGTDGGEAALRAAISAASREVIERIAWEVVPQLAEAILREHVSRLKGS